MTRRSLLATLAVTGALVVPTTASAATATIGSPLTAPPSGGTCGPSTFTNTALASNLTAPFDGFIVRWRIVILNPNPAPSYRLRVLRQQGGQYTGDGTGPDQGAPAAGLNVIPLPNPLPIHAGELIGVECPNAESPLAAPAPLTSTMSFFNPPLADGGPAVSPTNSIVGDEILINADIAMPPSNSFSLGTPTRNKRRGTATLPVTVPGPGTLALSGTGVLAQAAGPNRMATRSASAAGTVNLLIAATGKKRRKLKKKGKVGLLATVTYTPGATEVPGAPATHSAQITLRKQWKRR